MVIYSQVRTLLLTLEMGCLMKAPSAGTEEKKHYLYLLGAHTAKSTPVQNFPGQEVQQSLGTQGAQSFTVPAAALQPTHCPEIEGLQGMGTGWPPDHRLCRACVWPVCA
jgi:hypothetical protein